MAANMRDASLYDNASVALYSQLMYGVYTVQCTTTIDMNIHVYDYY